MWRWTAGWTSRDRAGLSGRGVTRGRRDGVPAGGPDGAGPASQGLVTLREGKYHQVKRMLAARGKPVTYLKTPVHGPLTLDPALPAGAWRPLTPEEKASLGR